MAITGNPPLFPESGGGEILSKRDLKSPLPEVMGGGKQSFLPDDLRIKNPAGNVSPQGTDAKQPTLRVTNPTDRDFQFSHHDKEYLLPKGEVVELPEEVCQFGLAYGSNGNDAGFGRACRMNGIRSPDEAKKLFSQLKFDPAA
ncbi:hypothetical protein [Methylacidimicrobium sp. B4]|uniref:hypothetical protein n=1 Tax=Methylacidimicrobium sp. B4 TaxID=2796139 RepID=UPI001A8F2482|nr:hypothetical protein [Methylacidimicrobium sp. B4]QSR85597.1 hypothetical protein MacB4_05090 [Methylacidimicrobium sp. B4]